MSEAYVSEKIYNEGLKRIEALMAASEARHEKIMTELKGTDRILEVKIDDSLNTFSLLFDELRDSLNRQFTTLSIIIGVIGVVFTAAAITVPIIIHFMK